LRARELNLKALFPTSSGFDTYSAVTYPGGVLNKTFASFSSWPIRRFGVEATLIHFAHREMRWVAGGKIERGYSGMAKNSFVYCSEFRISIGTNLLEKKYAVWIFDFDSSSCTMSKRFTR